MVHTGHPATQFIVTTLGTFTNVPSLEVEWHGSLMYNQWLRLTLETENDGMPCDKVNAEHAKPGAAGIATEQVVGTPRIQSLAGSKRMTFDTSLLDQTTPGFYAVCYATGDGTKTDATWKDSGIRIRFIRWTNPAKHRVVTGAPVRLTYKVSTGAFNPLLDRVAFVRNATDCMNAPAAADIADGKSVKRSMDTICSVVDAGGTNVGSNCDSDFDGVKDEKCVVGAMCDPANPFNGGCGNAGICTGAVQLPTGESYAEIQDVSFAAETKLTAGDYAMCVCLGGSSGPSVPSLYAQTHKVQYSVCTTVGAPNIAATGCDVNQDGTYGEQCALMTRCVKGAANNGGCGDAGTCQNIMPTSYGPGNGDNSCNNANEYTLVHSSAAICTSYGGTGTATTCDDNQDGTYGEQCAKNKRCSPGVGTNGGCGSLGQCNTGVSLKVISEPLIGRFTDVGGKNVLARHAIGKSQKYNIQTTLQDAGFQISGGDLIYFVPKALGCGHTTRYSGVGTHVYNFQTNSYDSTGVDRRWRSELLSICITSGGANIASNCDVNMDGVYDELCARDARCDRDNANNGGCGDTGSCGSSKPSTNAMVADGDRTLPLVIGDETDLGNGLGFSGTFATPAGATPATLKKPQEMAACFTTQEAMHGLPHDNTDYVQLSHGLEVISLPQIGPVSDAGSPKQCETPATKAECEAWAAKIVAPTSGGTGTTYAGSTSVYVSNSEYDPLGCFQYTGEGANKGKVYFNTNRNGACDTRNVCYCGNDKNGFPVVITRGEIFAVEGSSPSFKVDSMKAQDLYYFIPRNQGNTASEANECIPDLCTAVGGSNVGSNCDADYNGVFDNPCTIRAKCNPANNYNGGCGTAGVCEKQVPTVHTSTYTGLIEGSEFSTAGGVNTGQLTLPSSTKLMVPPVAGYPTAWYMVACLIPAGAQKHLTSNVQQLNDVLTIIKEPTDALITAWFQTSIHELRFTQPQMGLRAGSASAPASSVVATGQEGDIVVLQKLNCDNVHQITPANFLTGQTYSAKIVLNEAGKTTMGDERGGTAKEVALARGKVNELPIGVYKICYATKASGGESQTDFKELAKTFEILQTPATKPSVSIPRSIILGQDIVVSWSSNIGFSTVDSEASSWLGLFAKDTCTETHDCYVAYQFIDARMETGTVIFSQKDYKNSGLYEVRYFSGATTSGLPRHADTAGGTQRGARNGQGVECKGLPGVPGETYINCQLTAEVVSEPVNVGGSDIDETEDLSLIQGLEAVFGNGNRGRYHRTKLT
jgi:hypothetical protein